MRIPFHTNTRQHRELAAELASGIAGVDLQDDKVGAAAIARFEEQLAAYARVEHAIAVASGTDALTIALLALSLPPGSEVITCDFGFFATAAAIARAGHVPVLVDSGRDGYLIDPDRIAAAVTERTGAIVPVHMFGQVADMAAVAALARRRGIALVEDCAQALGARRNGQGVGTFGSAGIVSFNWSKHLGSIANGGAILTDDAEIASCARVLRAYGSAGGFRHEKPGINSKLDPFEAAVLSVKLPYLDGWIERRRTNAARYRANLADVGVVLPDASTDGDHVFHKFTIQTASRDALHKALAADGIGSMVCYPLRLSEQPGLGAVGRAASENANSRNLCQTVLSLPIYPELSDAEIDEISETVRTHAGAWA